MFHKTKRWLQPLKNESWYIIKHCARNAELYTKNINLQLDLDLKDEDGGDISSFIPNGEWDLIGKKKHSHTVQSQFLFHFPPHYLPHDIYEFYHFFRFGPYSSVCSIKIQKA